MVSDKIKGMQTDLYLTGNKNLVGLYSIAENCWSTHSNYNSKSTVELGVQI